MPWQESEFLPSPLLSLPIDSSPLHCESGRIPDYLNPPVGCRFHPRCEHAMEVCRVEKPRFYRVSEDHDVACFLQAGEETGR